MARIRYLKPDFFTDEDIAKLPFETRLLYQGLWVNADKEGRLEDRPESLKTKIFPYDDVDFESGLKLLEQTKNYSQQPFIHRYTAEGFRYIQIVSWHKHQKPHHTEKESEIPEPPELPLFQSKRKEAKENNLNTNLKIKKKINLNQLEASSKLDNGEVTVKEPLNINNFTEEVLKEWKKVKKLPFEKREINTSEIMAIEKAIYQLIKDVNDPIPESEIITAIKNYHLALKEEDSQTYQHKLYNFLQRHVRKYTSYAFDLELHKSTTFNKDRTTEKKNKIDNIAEKLIKQNKI